MAETVERDERAGADEIKPAAEYSASDTCKFFPSSHGGVISLGTLHRWRKEGKIAGASRRGLWYFKGAEILRVLGLSEPPPAPPVMSPTARRRAVAAADRECDRLGLK